MRTIAAGACAVSLAAAAATHAQQPTFRSGIELLTVQTSVLDKNGKPVRDLQPGDFTVTVDGRPRRVVFARFTGSDAATVHGSVNSNPSLSVSSDTELPSLRVPKSGRLVMFVIDRETIKTGNEKALIESGTRVVDALTSADAVGLIGVPSGGVKPTREHQRVRDALMHMTGTMPNMPWRWYISWAEAEGIERGDKQAMDQVINRECRGARPTADPDYNIVPEGCFNNIPRQAVEMLTTARAQARTTISTLRTLTQHLRAVRGPKHIVFVSGGLRFDQELLAEFNQFSHEAALAGIVVHTVYVDQPPSDAGTEWRTITQAFGGREMGLGLSTIAAMTGGGFFQGVATAAGVFERIATEITNYYELGLEASPADADGKPRKLDIKVNRPDVSVRARAEVAVDPSVAPRRGTPEALQALLEQPTDIVDLPLEVNTYSTRGDDPSLLKVLLAIEAGGPQNRAPAQWGFIVLNEGNVIASGRSTLEAAGPGPWTITAAAKLLPGKQRLRFAAIDADGRAGVVDVPLAVGLRVTHDLQLSDLIVGAVVGGRFQPGTRVQAGAPLAAMIEVLSSDPARLATTRVALEVTPNGAAEPVQRVLMAARTGIADTILINEAQINTARLSPGRYVATATTLIANEPVGKVTRPFEILAAAK